MAIINAAFNGTSTNSVGLTTTLYTCPATFSHAVVHVYVQFQASGASPNVATGELRIGTTLIRDLTAVITSPLWVSDFSGSFYVKSTQSIILHLQGLAGSAVAVAATLVTGYEVS